MRKTDKRNNVFRRAPDRLITRDNLWFFSTREGEGERGPFRSRQAAVLNLHRYMDTMEFLEDNIGSLPNQFNLKDVTIIDIEDRPRFL